MKIAVIGGGVSGLVSAFCLQNHHEVTVFEKEDWVGGHTHTIPVDTDNGPLWIDTGFIVCNNKNYTNFLQFIDYLNVEKQETTMSFSVSSEKRNLEYNGTNINKLFSQRKNIFKPKFWKLISEILRFNQISQSMIYSDDNHISFQEYIEKHDFSKDFCECYLYPMLGAIWSCGFDKVKDFPILFVLGFLDNHGMLTVNDRPQWYSLKNGSHTYVNKLLDLDLFKVVRSKEIKKVSHGDSVTIYHDEGNEVFDKVIIATHTNEALTIIEEIPDDIRKMLEATPYQDNHVVLHTDPSLMPKSKRAWAAWNYHLDQDTGLPTVTYYMNELQCLTVKQDYFVSLNSQNRINKQYIIKEFNYSHPSYTMDSYHYQKKHETMNINGQVYFAGAYWKNGFHEDGVRSALTVVKQIDKDVLCKTPFTMVT